MNKHILVAMDRKNRSDEELKKNYYAAADAFDFASFAVYHADFAAFDDATAVFDAASAAYYAAATAWNAAATAVDVEHWVKKYFEKTGEDRQEYEKALEEMKK